jgi:Fe2+ or Zn2+ uptake regulation protein
MVTDGRVATTIITMCRSCRAVKDVDCIVGHPTCLDPVDDAGYLVDEADVTLWGLWPQCRPEAG